MKKFDLGQSISILANIGVLAGITFLAYELHQNNELLKAEIRSSRQNLRAADYLLPLGNRDFANALIKHRHDEALTEYERLILNRTIVTTLLNWQYTFNEFKQGRIEENSIPVETWRGSFNGESLTQPGYWPDMSEYWEANKQREFQPEFVEWMDENVVDD